MQSEIVFDPIVVRSSNISKELAQVASTYKILPKDLDFNILSTKILTKTPLNATEEWVEQSVVALSREYYLDPKFEIKQLHEIEVFVAKPTVFDTLDISIAGNSTLCKVYLNIKKGSKIEYFDGFIERFIDLIHKRMLRVNLLIGVFDTNIKHSLKELFARVEIDKICNIESDERYLIAESYEPIETIHDELIYHYKNIAQKKDEQDRVDHSNRGFLKSVIEDGVVIEYIKPQRGTNGRNCRGELIVAEEPIIKHTPDFSMNETIKIVDKENSIEYRAVHGGYVDVDGGVIGIANELEIASVDFKTTGSIFTDLRADITLKIEQKDSLKDAVGQGLSVEVQNLDIFGTVAKNVSILAKKVKISGIVHQSAIVSADEIKIDVLKGEANGEDVEINRLELGHIKAKRAIVQQASGGIIEADDIIVETLGSNVHLIASKTIEVKKIVGSDNQFIIDPLVNEPLEELRDSADKEAYLLNSIRESRKELQSFEQTWSDNRRFMDDLTKKILHYKNAKAPVPQQFVQKYRQFQQLKDKIASLENELKTKEEIYSQITVRKTLLQSEIFGAKVINHDRWNSHNEVVFRLVKPQMEVYYVPSENSIERVLMLDEDDNGRFSVKVTS